ncbi:pci domain-containing protein [Colletotrichum truncatum]|uniref:Pci domain-containing protein n=1 Tax=Colletotrichum truncatum TaxID=5467 RepID=A0ACC3YZK7_COLTU|nr:pci domain-containing protein [Colletotrichum truncatum]KAF6781531.1 pci domain-containing protein [Colletotrichum truncatum]
MRTSFAVLALSAIAAVSAQRKVYSNTDVNVAAIDLNLKASWCTGQRNTCNILCDRTTANDCEPTTLKYTCTCNNGTAPGLEYYKQTIPTFICLQAFEDCIQANVGDSRGQGNCTTNIRSQCGTIDAQENDAATTTTTTSAPTNTPAGTGSGTTGSGSQASQTPATSSSQAYAAPTAAPARYGNAAAVAAIGLFAYML